MRAIKRIPLYKTKEPAKPTTAIVVVKPQPTVKEEPQKEPLHDFEKQLSILGTIIRF